MRRAVASMLPLFLALCGAAPAADTPAGLEGVPEIVAEVNGQPIHRDELIRELAGSSAAGALDRLVRRKLVEQAAQAAQVVVAPAEIEAQFAVDQRELRDELIFMPWDKNKEFPIADLLQARFKMTVDEYKTSVIRQRLLVRRCLAREIHFSDEDLLDFFNRYPDLFQPPVRYHACHILISPLDPRDMFKSFRLRQPLAQMDALRRQRNAANNASVNLDDAPSTADLDPAWRLARETAEKVLRQIRSGALTWDQALSQYTQDPLDLPGMDPETRRRMPPEREAAHLPPGDLGWFHKDGPLVPEFYRGVKDLKPGEIGGPVRTEYGFHLVKMLEIQAPPPVTFAATRDKAERLFIENEIQMRADAWLKDLVDRAVLKTERVLLWPPRTVETAVAPASSRLEAGATDDPVVGSVNDAPLRRSEVWRELVRGDGEEALDRLVNREVVLRLLKEMGVERLEWEAADPARRSAQPPPSRPIQISAETLDLELTDDRLSQDRLNTERARALPPLPALSFSEYIYQRYGQTVVEYQRALEAGLVLRDAIRQKVPLDEQTLHLQFALARDQYAQPAWYEASHILIVPAGGEKAGAAARLQAKLVADQIYRNCAANPALFTQCVRDFSMDTPENKNRDGSLGALPPDGGDTPDGAALYAGIVQQKLERGQVSAPISGAQGVHIVRVDAVHPKRLPEFEEVKARVERDYLQERAKMYTDLWLRALRARAVVKRYLFQAPPRPEEKNPPDNFPLPK